VVVGSTNFDLLLTLPRLPRSNDRLRPSDSVLAPGGMAGNVASAFARLGGGVRYAGAFTADDDGALLRSALVHDGVDVRFARERPGPGGRGLILVGARGERAIIAGWQPTTDAYVPSAGSRPVAANGHSVGGPARHARELSGWRALLATPWPLPDGLFAPPVDALYCPSIFAPAIVPSLPPDLPLAIDIEAGHLDALDEPALRCLLGRARFVFGNHGVLSGVAGRLGYARPEQLGADVGETLVVTLGARGCVAVCGGVSVNVPGFRVRAVDTTGAGDCFSAAFLLAALRGLDPVVAATFANAAAALSTRGLGSRAATPSLPEVEGRLRRRRTSRQDTAPVPTGSSHDPLCKALQLWHDQAAGTGSAR
jgi:ribokinase